MGLLLLLGLIHTELEVRVGGVRRLIPLSCELLLIRLEQHLMVMVVAAEQEVA